MLFPSIFRALVVATLATAGLSQNCQHGLTANDIAANSGVNLTGKVALVTGGRSGLGYAITEALLRVGCKVVIASRNLDENRLAVQKLQSAVSGADVSYMIFDLESFDNVRNFAANFIGNHTRLDYYFGNAGQGAMGTQPLTVDGYERIFQVNYMSQVLLLDQLLPLMRQSQPARVILTASSTHATACGALQLSPEDQCWGENGNASDMLPFDQAGLDAVGGTFECGPLYSTYPVSKFLMTQLAREVTTREAKSGNQVHAFSWAPGNINTNLNPWASCCVGPIDNGLTCQFQLPYVGPKDEEGNPNPPDPPEQNLWSSPAHGTMAAIYSALVANTTTAGNFRATYWECEAEKGYFSQGITPAGRSEIYEMSQSWYDDSKNIPTAAPTDRPVAVSTSSEPTDKPTDEPSSAGAMAIDSGMMLGALAAIGISCVIFL